MTDATPTGVIQDVAVLDLTPMTSREELAGITEIRDVATLLVRESLMSALAAIPITDVATVIPVPDGARVNVHTGSLKVSGEALGGQDAEGAILVVTGSLIVTSPVERVAYRQAVVTGEVLAPTGSEAALGTGITRMTGSVDYFTYAEGQQITTVSGQTKISGAMLANSGGSRDDVLFLAGQVVVTGPVQQIGYQSIFISGQIMAPRESQPILGPVATVHGQVAWYDGRPRFFMGKERFGSGFFELLDEPLALGLMGGFEVEPDVDPQLVKNKISDITLIGKIVASGRVVPMLQLLTTESYGKIMTYEDAGGQC